MQNPEVERGATGIDGRFNTTHWSAVLAAGQGQSAHGAAALEALCRAYWKPIYRFARYKGYPEEDAKDPTQHFFFNLLERNDFSGLDPRKGKFRTYLLTAFTHFLANERDRAGAQKRGGGKSIVSFDELSDEEAGFNEPNTEASPARVFDLRWAELVVKQALGALQAEMNSSGKSGHFEALKGFLTTEPAEGGCAAAARILGVAESSVPVLVHRLRQRYRQIVRAQVAQTVASPAELEEEMRHLFEVLNQ